MPSPVPLFKLILPGGPEDEKASGATSDQDTVDDNATWEEEIGDHGLFAATCNAHSILINGDHSNRLGKRARKRPGDKLVTLLNGGELYSSGERAKPLETPWVSSFLCTFHREPYIQSRGDRRCQCGDCFENGIALTLHGTSTKRCQHHIEEALVSITRPLMSAETGDMPLLCDPPPIQTATSSRRPIQNSAGSNESGNSSAGEATCLADQLHNRACQKDVFTPACRTTVSMSGTVASDLPATPSLSKLGVVSHRRASQL